MSVSLCVCLPVCLSVCWSVYPSVCLSVYLSVCLSVGRSVCLFVICSFAVPFSLLGCISYMNAEMVCIIVASVDCSVCLSVCQYIYFKYNEVSIKDLNNHRSPLGNINHLDSRKSYPIRRSKYSGEFDVNRIKTHQCPH